MTDVILAEWFPMAEWIPNHLQAQPLERTTSSTTVKIRINQQHQLFYDHLYKKNVSMNILNSVTYTPIGEDHKHNVHATFFTNKEK